MRRNLTAALFAGALVAANFTMQPNAWGAAHVVGPSTSSIGLEIGKGRLIRLDTPATYVFIADPKIADIEVKSPTLVYVIGKVPGGNSGPALALPSAAPAAPASASGPGQ